MLRFYKKHIALFFTLLFITSQLNYVVHTLFEHQHDVCEHAHPESHETDSKTYKTVKEKASFNETHDCAVCQLFQSIRLVFVKVFNLDIHSQLYNGYKFILFTKSLLSSFLLEEVSLRGPPSFFIS